MLSDRYIDLIIEWTAKINLTGLKSASDIRTKLYDDSLNIAKAADLSGHVSVVDIGCGAGFPGIPLKLENPNIELTLIDSVKKKITFLEHVINELGLKDTKAVCGRAEDLVKGMREKFDLSVAKAVSQLNVLCEYCLPYVKVGGSFMAIKGPDIEKEVSEASNAVKLLGGRLKERIKIPSGELVVIDKISSTPAVYPRPAGVPAKKPL